MHRTSIRIVALALLTAALTTNYPAEPVAPRDETAAARDAAPRDAKAVILAQTGCSSRACR